ncbi:MAG: hypothetical protein GOU98_02385 [Candidatus Altiarchaeota archaeon]|nr:hypothetical protein [Candidatus Altiarchaeota archaeon]
MVGKKLFLVFLVLFLGFSVAFSEDGSQCADCDAVDCTTQSDPPAVCSDAGTGGCKKITRKTGFEECDYTISNIECGPSTHLFLSNDPIFSTNGFVFDTNHPYYCLSPATDKYIWKTCYSGSAKWVEGNLLCNGGVEDTVIMCNVETTCGASSTIYTIGLDNYVCDLGSWKKTSDLIDSCSVACEAVEGVGAWDSGSSGRCCTSSDNWIFGDNSNKVCDDGTYDGASVCSGTSCSGVDLSGTTNYCTSTGWDTLSNSCSDCADKETDVCVATCDINSGDIGTNYFGTEPNGNCCGDDGSEYYEDSLCDVGVTCDGGSYACIASLTSCIWSGTEFSDQACSGSLFCNSGTWITDADSNELACTCIVGDGYWGGLTNKCCEVGDAFDFNSTATCNNGVIEFDACESDIDVCNINNQGERCLKTGDLTYTWTSSTCYPNYFACDGGTRKTNCEYLDGWISPQTNENGIVNPNDPGVFENHTCSGTVGAYSCQNTEDTIITECDDLDDFYAVLVSADCGPDTVRFHDYFVSYVSPSVFSYSCGQEYNATSSPCDGPDSCESNACKDGVEVMGQDGYPEILSSRWTGTCLTSQSESTPCSEKGSTDSDGGDNPWVRGYVIDYLSTCADSTSCSLNQRTDNCENTQWLNEYVVSSYSTQFGVYLQTDEINYDCTTFSTCDVNRTCGIGSGVCVNNTANPDSEPAYCESKCSATWISNWRGQGVGNCCGDDTEFVKSDLVGDVCCNQDTDCAMAGKCYDQNNFDDNYRGFCGLGSIWDFARPKTLCSIKQASGSNYYATNVNTDSAKWATASESKDVCSFACSELFGSWRDGSIVTGTSNCCDSGSTETILDGVPQHLCNGETWLSAQTVGVAPYNEDIPGFEYARYLGDGQDWDYCDGIFREKLVDSVNYVCTSGGWQNEACTNDQNVDDLGVTYCEVICGGDWITSLNTCCGNTLEDEYFIGDPPYTEACDAGLKICDADSICDTATLASDAYYCYDGSWSTSEVFEGSHSKYYDGDLGCCKETQCWGGDACYAFGASKGLEICTENGWVECTTANQCSTLSTTSGNYYCTDTGWNLQNPELCLGGGGICNEGVCLGCPGDYSYGQEVNGFYCTTTGFTEQECVTNTDCSGDSCNTGTCVSGVCQSLPAVCGSPCDVGVCDGSGACANVLDVGASCTCDSNCLPGLYCGNGICTEPEDCGDGICQAGECSACQEDCSLDQCSGDGVCSYSLGETCDTTTDCACSYGYCDTDQGNEWGCVTPICGNDVCELGECSYCANDCSVDFCGSNGVCDVALGETCDNSDDCTCGIIFETETVPVLKIGETSNLRFYVENTGNAPIVIDLSISSEGFEISGSNQKVYLSPYERKDVTIEVTANQTGTQKINFLAKSSKGVDLSAPPIDVTVKEQQFWEAAVDAFKRSPVYPIFEALDIILLVLGAAGLFFKIIIPKKKYNLNPYGAQGQTSYPGYYNQSQQPYAPPQQQNYGQR